MAGISTLSGFNYNGGQYNFARDGFKTLQEMFDFPERYMPPMHLALNEEDNNLWLFSANNPEIEPSKKWRIFKGGTADLIDYYKKNEIQALLEDYVAKEDGKGLSANDYTTLEKEKLAGLENYDDSGIVERVSNVETSVTDIQTSIGNAPLNTVSQNLSEAVNEIKSDCDTTSTTALEKITKNENDIAILNGDKTVNGSVAKKIASCLSDSKLYTDQKIAEMASEQAIVADEKPSYSNGITTYIKDGIPETTDEENIWFYYEQDGKLMQTIFINGENITIVSAGSVNFQDFVSKTNDVVSNYTGDEADVSKVPNLGAMKELETKLQTDIDDKISGDEIYDGVDSTSTTSALSANQGKILNDAINTKLNKTFSGEDIANKILKTDSLGNVVLGTHDESLDVTSTNSVQNKAIKTELDKKFDIAQSVDKAGYVAVIGDDGNMTFSDPTTLGGKAEIVAYTNDEYPDLTNVDKALDKILAKIYYLTPEITNFAVTPNVDTYEIGTVLASNTLTFSWGVNKDIISQALTDCTISIDDRSCSYDAELKSSKTFVLTISDSENTATASKKISFLYPIYYGCCAEVEEYNNDFILALENKKLVTNNKSTYNFICGDGEFAYFATPTTMKISSAWVNGFQSDVEEVATVSHQNSSGHTSSYTISRFRNSGLGSFVAEVK